MAKYPLPDGPHQVNSQPPAAPQIPDPLPTAPIPEQGQPVINITEASRFEGAKLNKPKGPKLSASSKNFAVAQAFGRRQEPEEQLGKNPKLLASSKNPLVAGSSDPGALLRRAFSNAGTFSRRQAAAASADTSGDSGCNGTTTEHKNWNPISFKNIGFKHVASSKNPVVKAAYGRRQATPPSFPPPPLDVGDVPPPPILLEKPKGIQSFTSLAQKRGPAVAARYDQGG
ncbi:MAG: hypothetical protein Q9181_006224 [Wetmoreana brouardii]